MESEWKGGKCEECGFEVSPDSTTIFYGELWNGTVNHRSIDGCLESLKSRISSLEAALSLDPENVERVTRVYHPFLDGYFPDKRFKVKLETEAWIKAIRHFAGLTEPQEE